MFCSSIFYVKLQFQWDWKFELVQENDQYAKHIIFNATLLAKLGMKIIFFVKFNIINAYLTFLLYCLFGTYIHHYSSFKGTYLVTHLLHQLCLQCLLFASKINRVCVYVSVCVIISKYIPYTMRIRFISLIWWWLYFDV